MKKWIFSVLTILILASSLSVVFADIIAIPTEKYVPSNSDLTTAPIISNLEIHNDGANNVWLEVTVQTPKNVQKAIDYYESLDNQEGYISGITLQYAIDGAEEWSESGLNYSPNYDQNDDHWNGIFETGYLSELHVDSQVTARALFTGATVTGYERVSDPSNELVLNTKTDFKSSTWAISELVEADKLELIPDSLKSADLTKPITREEFAEVSVKAYEALTGNTAIPVTNNPFTDTNNPEVLKAFNLGITAGVSETKFDPNALLNREQAATMLTRTYKKAIMEGWTLATDSEYPLEYIKTNTFADDENISAWAKDSVYFMNAHGVINGVGDNKFAPRNVTPAEEAIGYANATREQAIIIAMRIFKNL